MLLSRSEMSPFDGFPSTHRRVNGRQNQTLHYSHYLCGIQARRLGMLAAISPYTHELSCQVIYSLTFSQLELSLSHCLGVSKASRLVFILRRIVGLLIVPTCMNLHANVKPFFCAFLCAEYYGLGNTKFSFLLLFSPMSPPSSPA